MTYQPIYKPSQIIIGTGAPVIVTGWTPAKKIASMLQPDQYAAIGQLYNASRGINYLIRNLLANPQIKTVIGIDATEQDKITGSVECFRDFFISTFSESVHHETGQPKWVINSPIPGYIDIEISEAALHELKRSVNFCYYRSLDKFIDHWIEDSREWETPTRSRQIYPLNKPESPIVPGQLYGHRIEAKTIAEAWVKLIHRIRTTGKIRPTSYDGQWQELIDLMVVVTDEPEEFSLPDYLPVTNEFLREYIPQMIRDSESSTYTYGQRMRSHFGEDQVEQAIQKLVAEPNSSRAVISLWDISDNKIKSPPCLNHIWIRIVDGKLTLTATFRSNDMFSAWVANAMGLRALQWLILEGIEFHGGVDLSIGALIMVSQSAHIYDDCFDSADNLIANQYPAIVNHRDYSDPSGNFAVSCEGKEIVIEWLTSDNSATVKTYRGRKALKLSLEVVKDCPAMTVENALYLGRKLQEAEYALRQE